MVDLNPTVSIITLKANGLNTTNKRDRQGGSSTICCLQETHLKYEDMHRLTIKRWRKIYHDYTNKEKEE